MISTRGPFAPMMFHDENGEPFDEILVNMSVTNDNLRANTQQIRSQTALNNVSAKKVASDILMSQADRARALALQPAYNAAGGIISGGIATAKRAYNALTSSTSSHQVKPVVKNKYNVGRDYSVVFGRGK